MAESVNPQTLDMHQMNNQCELSETIHTQSELPCFVVLLRKGRATPNQFLVSGPDST